MVPDNVYYTKEHEWVLIAGDTATIGITDHAQSELGDIVYLELPEVGTTFTQMDELGVVESVKTVSTIYCPLSGDIIEVNEDAITTPELLNESPYGDGWLVRIKASDLAEIDDLMNAEDYESFLTED